MRSKVFLEYIVLISAFVHCGNGRHAFQEVNSYVEREEQRLQKEMETNSIIDSSEDYFEYDKKSSSNEKKPEVINDSKDKQLIGINKVYKPIVYWHGMGDSGVHVKNALSFIEDHLPGVYVKSFQIGETIAEDVENGYFMNVNDQVALVCEMIKNDTLLQNGYNAIGLSQGGQFLRAVAQRCPQPQMLNLISLGGQHQGIFGLPKCQAPKHEWCELIDKLLTHLAYEKWVQKFLVQSEYWHDPFKNDQYINNSVFLADINNERVVNEEYKKNLQQLENIVLVLFEDETVVEPKQTEWFGFFAVGSDKKFVALEDSALYTEDRLGLKKMNEMGKLHFLSSPGDHLRFTKDWFIEHILKPYLA